MRVDTAMIKTANFAFCNEPMNSLLKENIHNFDLDCTYLTDKRGPLIHNNLFF